MSNYEAPSKPLGLVGVVHVVSVLRDSFMDKKYEFVIDNNKQYFFDKKKYKFKTVEELEKYFNI